MSEFSSDIPEGSPKDSRLAALAEGWNREIYGQIGTKGGKLSEAARTMKETLIDDGVVAVTDQHATLIAQGLVAFEVDENNLLILRPVENDEGHNNEL